jgi:hypothetical protein
MSPGFVGPFRLAVSPKIRQFDGMLSSFIEIENDRLPKSGP